MKDSKINSINIFGLNIAFPKKTIQEVQKVAQQELEGFTVNPFIEYFEENDKVLTGEVEREIRKYQSQMYTLGQVMREGKPINTFNMKM